MDCGECKLPLPTDGDAAVCGKCDNGYHFDCTTVSKSSWMSMGPTRQTAWRCLPCKDVKAKRLLMSSQQLSASQSGGGTSSGGGGDDISQKMEAFGKQLEAFNKNLTEKLNRGFVDSEQKIKAKLNEFEESLNFYGNTIDEANKTVKSLEQKLVLMEKRLEKSENENKELKSRLRTLEVHMHETSQKEYNNKIEISGLVNKNVDSARTVQKILELCNTNQMHAKAELQLATFVLLYLNFFDEKYRHLNTQPYELRTQRYRRPHVYSVQYGERRLEFIIPFLLNTYCQQFLSEMNKHKVKMKIKEKILRQRE
ncbi:hypothetical protein M8J76_001437 [Diaphorina citri]|nr:hypothetical protein M8J76_001437 [Diaphorina citri]